MKETAIAVAELETPAVAPSLSRFARHWIGWSLPALPVAVLLHELAHFALYWLFGFPGVRLHYAAVSHDLHLRFFTLIRSGDVAGAAAVAPLWQVGVASGSAILVSYATILAAGYLTFTRPAHPFIVAVGLVATLRFQIGITILRSQLLNGERFVSGTDEGLTAAALGLPEPLLWCVGLAVALTGWVLILAGLSRGRRLREFGAVALGAILGGFVYALWLGPWLLPARIVS